MFASPIPSPRVVSFERLVASVLLHATALTLAALLRFTAAPTTAAAKPVHLTLAAPVRVALDRTRWRPPRPLAPSPARAPARAFQTPVLTTPTRPPEQLAKLSLSASLPESVSAPPSEAPRPGNAPTLPPPPIVLGKLAAAGLATLSPEPARAPLRTGVFGTPETAAAEKPGRRATPSAVFGNASVETTSRGRNPNHAAPISAVEIVSKPRPLYTEDARRLRIEGEVLLEVLFTAAGVAQVQRVVRGLGHGLDETAAASASQIQFRPARRDGQPVDQLATVHITFQLAY